MDLFNGSTCVSIPKILNTKRSIEILRNLSFSILPLALLFLIPARSVSREIKGDIELLRLVAKKNKENFDALKTWQGKVTIQTSGENPASTDNGKAIFAYDREKQYYMYLTERTGKHPSNRYKWGGIRKPEGYFEVEGFPDKTFLKNATKMRILKRRRSFSRFTLNFDALVHLKVQRQDVHDYMMGFYDPKHRARRELTVTREKNLVRFILEKRAIELKVEYIFDLEQGANAIEINLSEPDIVTNFLRKFSKVNGVWVPTFSTGHRIYPMTGEVMKFTVTWDENIVNEPIPAGIFQPEKIGVEKGDMVTDTRIDETYPYEGSVDNESSSWFWPALIITSLVLLAMIAVVFGRRMLFKNALNNS